MTRIIAGEHKGRRLETSPDKNTRPTTDRVRESLMSALASKRGGFDGAAVFDAFAGSGALALEAMSRGALFSCLMDSNAQAISVIRKNVSNLKYTSSAVDVVKADAFKVLPRRGVFDLVFLDPPYAYSAFDVAGIVLRLKEHERLKPGALIVYEHDQTDDDAAGLAFEGVGCVLLSRRCISKTTVDIFEME